MTNADAPEAAPLSALPTIRVLIVDDEALGRLRVNNLVRNEKGVHVVGEAADGEAAVNAQFER